MLEFQSFSEGFGCCSLVSTLSANGAFVLSCTTCFKLQFDRLSSVQESQLKLDHSSPAEDAGRFRTTRWSVVLLSAQSQTPDSEAALAELCRLYWYLLYAFVRRDIVKSRVWEVGASLVKNS